MRSWLIRDARAHLSDVFDAALQGEPQRVTRRGKEAVVVVSEQEWLKTRKPQADMAFAEFVATFPIGPEEWAEVAPARGRSRPNPFAPE
ncbi:MAG TPA: type II toxin-antitoxin system Phd/YefM family antitoxin [Salinarimonas sp.]|jgi:prevent-host-death family protein|nr:type II toxin-antitoxin system Phd/YefM family antitoxin [Salinarimonas sp.]